MTGRARITPEDLRRIESPDDLLGFLQDSLNWPLSSATFEEVTYSWTPEEVGINPERFPSLRSIRQLQPIVANQPWGIFFIDFDGPRVPITPLRRMLSALVTKQRRAKDSPTWNLEDLLFVITTSDEHAVEFHLMAFRPDASGAEELRSLPWRPRQSPDRHLERLARELLPRLEWPEDDADVDSWRVGWQDAFRIRHGDAIGGAARLAERMASTAIELRDLVLSALDVEDGEGPLSEMLDEVRAELVADASAEDFADMCAQTLVYGLLTARITDPEGFGASPTLAAVPLSNPFLEAFFEKVHDQTVAVDDDESVEQLVADLRKSNVETILDNFGSSAKGGDPVIHFYEEFLKLYDPVERKQAGAFYTPVAVVDFMVRGVDELLKARFGLELGIADPSTWAQVAERNEFDIPAGTDPDAPFVSMIDPATGTGTYLVSWIRQARASFCAVRDEVDWPQHLRDFVLPSMHAFELMLAPFAIAHLKVAMELRRDGVSEAGLGIHLTDTLERRTSPPQLEYFEDPVAAEGIAALRIKEHEPITVCIGNPPYLRTTAAASGGWVLHPEEGYRSLFDDILDVAKSHTIFSHQASLYNLFVYFWRWALWKVFESRSGSAGVACYITASSWLTGPGFMGLRQLARELGSEIIVVDLGGDGRGAHQEENVFDIQTPVAIVFVINDGSARPDPSAIAAYRRISGTRAEKISSLETAGIDIAEDQLTGSVRSPLAPPAGGADWAALPALVDLIPWQQPGCKFGRTWPIATTPEVLSNRWDRLLSTKNRGARATCFVTPSTGRNIDTQVAELPRIADLKPGAPHRPIVRYAYRSFDRQWAFNDPRLAALERPSLWAASNEQQVYLISKTTHSLVGGPGATTSTDVPDLDCFRGSYGGKDIFPMFRDAAGTPNADPVLLDRLSSALGRDAAVDPEHLFAYCYGVLAGADYTSRFATELKTPGPRIPLTADAALFSEMVAHGEHLLWLQTYGERFRTRKRKDLVIPKEVRWRSRPTRIPADTRDFAYDSSNASILVADGRLDGVVPDVWAFSVNGMQVVKKWLGYRTAKGTGKAVSSKSPLDHIRPTEWADEWSHELRELIAVLTITLEQLPTGVEILDRIMAGPLVPADDLPDPPAALREPPKLQQGLHGGLFSQD